VARATEIPDLLLRLSTQAFSVEAPTGSPGFRQFAALRLNGDPNVAKTRRRQAPSEGVSSVRLSPVVHAKSLKKVNLY